MAYQSTSAMLAEMRDLGWNGDADSWESYILDWGSRDSMRDIRADIRSELEEMRKAAGNPCEWFAGCTREATHREAHPAFPDGVPCCDRCSGIGR